MDDKHEKVATSVTLLTLNKLSGNKTGNKGATDWQHPFSISAFLAKFDHPRRAFGLVFFAQSERHFKTGLENALAS
jgi:hypothetical protein